MLLVVFNLAAHITLGMKALLPVFVLLAGRVSIGVVQAGLNT